MLTYIFMLFGIISILYLFLAGSDQVGFPLEKKKKEGDKFIPLKTKISSLCSNKVVYLVDFENVAKLPKEIVKDTEAIIFVFVGYYQKRKAENMSSRIDVGNNIHYIYMEKVAHNYLDIYLGCYLGAILSTYEPKEIKILSRDKGFYSLIDASKSLGYARISYFELKQKYTFNENEIERSLDYILLLEGSRIMEYKVFRKLLQKYNFTWVKEQVDAFISECNKRNCIKIKKVGDMEVIQIIKQ